MNTTLRLLLAVLLLGQLSCGRSATENNPQAASVLFTISWKQPLVFSVDGTRTDDQASCGISSSFRSTCLPLDEDGQIASPDDLCPGTWTFSNMFLWAAEETECTEENSIATCHEIVDVPISVGQNLVSVNCRTTGRGRVKFDVYLDP